MTETRLLRVVTAAVLFACSSNPPLTAVSSAGGGGEGSNGAAGAGPSGASDAGAGAGMSGGVGASGSAGTGGAAGGAGSGGTAGSSASDSAGASGSAGSSDGGAAGSNEIAIVASYLGGMVVYAIHSDDGALEPIMTSPFDKGAQLLGVAAAASGKFVYATDFSKGLRPYAIASDSGRLSPLTSAPIALPGVVDGPVAVDPQGRFLYASAEQKLYTYVLDADGVPSLANVTAPTLTGSLAYIEADPSGHYVYAVQGTGMLGYSVNATTGELKPVPSATFSTTPNLGGALAISPNGKYLYNTASGLNTFAIDPPTGGLTLLSQTPVTLDVGGDPYSRVFALDSSGEFAFTVHMLNGHFGAFHADASTGLLSALDHFPVTLTELVYSVGIEPSGRFVYVGADTGTIAGYSLDRAHRTLTAMTGPPFPLDGLQPEMVFVTLAP